MKHIILICLLICHISFAHAQDFYSENLALFDAKQFERVKSNALNELSIHQNSIEANYFMALVTIWQSAKAAPSQIYEKNFYAEKFQELYRKLGKAEKLTIGDQFEEADIRFVSLYYILGMQYYSKKEYANAAEWLNLASIGFENNFEFNLVAGTSFYAIRNFEKAQRYLLVALKINPNHGDANFNMACLNAVLDNPAVAVTWLKKAISIDEKYRELAKSDSDFDNIRKSALFQQLMKR